MTTTKPKRRSLRIRPHEAAELYRHLGVAIDALYWELEGCIAEGAVGEIGKRQRALRHLHNLQDDLQVLQRRRIP